MSDMTPTPQEAALAVAAAKADPFFTAAYDTVFERRRLVETRQTLAELNAAIAEMDAASKVQTQSRDVERSAYAHLVEAKKVWRLAMQVAEADGITVMQVCAKVQAILDARQAARA